ncbi:hypothetical protein A2U01_0110377 [Trifolium medium]|uniref:Uncharacterized protein n=1 Tax=Trifolium medium TaxID=97028 RepID=A0A392VNW1_9FABA|nr:hypothetical protein [Trifolium medium]
MASKLPNSLLAPIYKILTNLPMIESSVQIVHPSEDDKMSSSLASSPTPLANSPKILK